MIVVFFWKYCNKHACQQNIMQQYTLQYKHYTPPYMLAIVVLLLLCIYYKILSAFFFLPFSTTKWCRRFYTITHSYTITKQSEIDLDLCLSIYRIDLNCLCVILYDVRCFKHYIWSVFWWKIGNFCWLGCDRTADCLAHQTKQYTNDTQQYRTVHTLVGICIVLSCIVLYLIRFT